MLKHLFVLLLSAILFVTTVVTLNTFDRNNSNILAAQVTSSSLSSSGSSYDSTSTPNSPTLETLDITPKDSLSKSDIKDLLQTEKYDYLEFGSSFNIGSDTLVDKVSKSAVDSLDNLDVDHFNNRHSKC